jgi:hypothetical protein
MDVASAPAKPSTLEGEGEGEFAPIPFVRGDYRPGCVVSVPVHTEVGRVIHVGILSDRFGPDGCPMVIHAAKIFGKIIEDTMTVFMLHALGPVCSEGYPGILAPTVVMARARAEIGKPWRPWSNCEHLVTMAHGLPTRSPQIRSAAKKTAVVAASASAVAAIFLLARGA